jgi:hypothetical protein
MDGGANVDCLAAHVRLLSSSAGARLAWARTLAVFSLPNSPLE